MKRRYAWMQHSLWSHRISILSRQHQSEITGYGHLFAHVLSKYLLNTYLPGTVLDSGDRDCQGYCSH